MPENFKVYLSAYIYGIVITLSPNKKINPTLKQGEYL